jgi:hypothetical protein
MQITIQAEDSKKYPGIITNFLKKLYTSEKVPERALWWGGGLIGLKSDTS